MQDMMKGSGMAAAETTGVAFGIKSGLLGGAFLLVVSVIAVLTGLRVVPPAPGREREDIERRLAAGFLCSLTLGPYTTYKYVKSDPEWLTFWVTFFSKSDDKELLGWMGAGLPFVALYALAGFWIVAMAMRWLTNRDGKDIGEVIKEVKP